MIRTVLIIASVFLLAYNAGESRRQTSISEKVTDSVLENISTSDTQTRKEKPALADTTSTKYLTYLLENEKPLSPYWMTKLDTIDGLYYSPGDSLTHLSLIRNWVINDSVSVIIFGIAGGTSYDEFLITVKNDHEIVSNIHIGDNDDSDLSFGNPYYYTKYKLLGHRSMKLFHHKVMGQEGVDEKDRLISVETWTIDNMGKASKQ